MVVLMVEVNDDSEGVVRRLMVQVVDVVMR